MFLAICTYFGGYGFIKTPLPVERDGYAFDVEVQYEKLPLFCHHCNIIGHNVSNCKWLHTKKPMKKIDHGEKPTNNHLVATKNGNTPIYASGEGG